MRMLMCVGARVYVCAWVRVYINIYINIFKRFHIVWRTCFSDVSSLVGCWFAAGEEEGEKELLAVITQMCRIFLESFTSHKNPSVFKTCFLLHTLCTSRQFIAGPHEKNTNKDIHSFTHLRTVQFPIGYTCGTCNFTQTGPSSGIEPATVLMSLITQKSHFNPFHHSFNSI